jgi:hypothetical protein
MDQWSSRPNGRDSRGRFAVGNPGGPGNPFAERAAALRKAFYATATEADLQAIARQVLDQAKAGSGWSSSTTASASGCTVCRQRRPGGLGWPNMRAVMWGIFPGDGTSHAARCDQRERCGAAFEVRRT